MRSWEEAGVPLDGMAAAVREGALSFSYLDSSAFDRFAGISGTTFQQLSDETGIPFDLLKVVREAVGFAEPRPEDHVREDELSVVPAIELQLSMGFRPAVIEGWLRVCADALRRIAETETDWWRTEVELPLLQGGMTETEMLDAQAETGSRMTPLLEQALVGIYRVPAGTRLEQERRGGRRGCTGEGRPAPPGAPAAGRELPRHQRVHASHGGARGRSGGGPGRDAGRPRPAVLARSTGASR